MGNIVLLDELTINQIAAGEVIERPASVIKEMIENSIDAGATNINVEIKNGGISYIRITDNGKGVEPDDMELAFERHATSKIRSASDLERVKSMGFRGEALASIAAIAKVEMMSRTINQNIGNRIVVEAGSVLEKEEVGCPLGTTITVQNLFFNTPVRYKFLKKDYTESGYIEDILTRLALIHPHIAFKLINTGKTILQTSGNGKMQDVIYAIYGKDVASASLTVDCEYEMIHVTGVVGKPEVARSNRSNQLFFVNKRYVKDKLLSGAAENSFKGLLPVGKYGFLILNVSIPANQVDVNVHPAKLEVRFQEENKVYKAVYHAIKDTLLKAELIANVKEEEEDKSANFNFTPTPPINSKPNISELFRKIVKNSSKELEQSKSNVLEDVYRQRDQEKISPSIPKPQERKTTTNTIKPMELDYNTPSDKKMDVFKELLAMQQRLKEEVEKNPTIHTQVDTLIQNTKTMKQNYEEEEKLEREKILEQMKKEEKEKLEQASTVDILAEIQKQAGEPFLTPEIKQEDKEVSFSSFEPIQEEKQLEESKKELPIMQMTTTIPTINVFESIQKEEPFIEQVQEEERQDPVEEQNHTITLVESLEQEKPQIIEEVEKQEESVVEEVQDQPILEEVDKTKEQTQKISFEASNIQLQNPPTVILEETLPSINSEKEQEVEKEKNEELKESEECEVSQDTKIFTSAEIQEMMNQLEAIEDVDHSPEFDHMYEKIFGKPPASVEQKKKEEEAKMNAYELIKEEDNISVFEEQAEYEQLTYKLVGIVFNTYILIEIEEEFYIIDQHAAHERILYEKIRANYYSEETKDSQLLLLPDVITLTHKEIEILKDNVELFEKAGFELEAFGENAIKLTGVPNSCIDLDTKELFLETLDEINTVARTAKQEIEEKFIATIACKAAVKAHMELSPEEVEQLLSDLLSLPNPFTCPHGRPIAIKMEKTDLEKKFARRK